MKKCTLVFLVALLAIAAHAQTATFTWNGSTDSSQLVELATINNIPVDQATGWGGAIQIVNQNFLWTLELPYCQYGTACVPLGFPNNGQVATQSQITWGGKQWGTRADGSTMNGSQVGDYYHQSGTTLCQQWNGTTFVGLTTFREFVLPSRCYREVCDQDDLRDVMQSGNGFATVQ